MAEYYSPGAGFRITCKYKDWLTRPSKDTPYGAPDEPYQHEGVDWARVEGTPIPAAADGTVYYIENEINGYGHYVVLHHKNTKNEDVYTIYAQMREATPLKKGDTVKKRQTVGYVGKTGNATGSHVHFEIRLGNYTSKTTTDPARYDLSQLKSINSPAQSSTTNNTNKNNEEDEPAIEPYHTPTACENKQFIVQIMGEKHPLGQKIYIADHQGQDKNKKYYPETIPESPSSLLSQLFCWEWCAIENKNYQLWLEIAVKGKGEPIKLPLLEKLQHTKREGDQQHNQIIPIIPLTPLYSSNYKTNQNEIKIDPYEPVHVREGWFYIFKDNKLWRELEIRKATSGYTYHDVRVETHRAENGKFKDDKRPAVGLGLQEIWIPARWNNADLTDNGFFYSEVQLSKERVNYLETKNERAHPINMKASASDFKRLLDGMQITEKDVEKLLLFQAIFYTNASKAIQDKTTQNRKNLVNHAFPLSLTSPQRTRFELYEWLFDHPVQYVCDTQGQYTKKCLDEAKKYIKSYTDGKATYPLVYDASLKTTSNRRKPNSQVAVGVALEEVLVPKRKEAIARAGLKTETKALENEADKKLQELLQIWEPRTPEVDILENARKRKIIGIMVQDPLYRLRQLQSQLNAAQTTINLAAELATYQKNHGCAVLIENIILPATINGNENSLKASFDKVSSRVNKKDIDYATAKGLRDPAKTAYEYALRLFIREYNKEANYPVLADICSLNGFDYLGGLYFISKLTTTLSAQLYDPIQIEMQQGKHNQTAISTLINSLNDTKHPMSLFVWSESSLTSDLTKPHKEQKYEENKGNGLCRSTELARIQNLEKPTEVMADTQFLESKLLADFATKESSLRTGAKAIGSAILDIYSKILDSLAAAQASYHKEKLATLKIDLKLNQTGRQITNTQQGIDINTQNQQANTTQKTTIDGATRKVDTQIDQNTTTQTTHTNERSQYEQIARESTQNETTARRAANERIAQGQATAQDLHQHARTQRSVLLSEAQQAVMNLYERAGSQLRQVHPDFYPLILDRAGNVNIKDYFVLLWDNMDELRPRVLQNINGRLTAPDGTTHAVTNIQEARTLGFTPTKSNQRLWMMPRTPETEQIILNYFMTEESAGRARQAVTDIVAEGLSHTQAWHLMAQDAANEISTINSQLAQLRFEESKLQNQRAQLQTTRAQNAQHAAELQAQQQQLATQLEQLRAKQQQLGQQRTTHQQTQDAARSHLETKSRLSARTAVIPSLVLALETYNLFTESSNYSATNEQKGGIRSKLILGSAGLDFVIAADALAERIRNAQAGKVLAYYSTSSTYLAAKLGTGSVIMRLLPSLTIRLTAQIVTSGIFAVLSLMDAYDAGRAGNPAAWGHLLIAAGAGVSFVSGVLAAMAGSSASAIASAALLGPAGWTALILIIAGATWVSHFNYNDIQTWLVNGPFGLPSTNYIDIATGFLKDADAYSYLKDEAEAYYFLLSLLSNSHVKVTANPLQQQAKDNIKVLQEQGTKIEAGLQKLADANVQVEVTSGFAGLVIEKQLHKEIRAKFIQHDYKSSFTPNMPTRLSHTTSITVLADNLNYLLQETTITGTTYYYKIDNFNSQLLTGDNLRGTHRKYALPVRVQIALNIITPNDRNTTTTEDTKPKKLTIDQYQWFFPAPILATQRKPQPTNKEPQFTIGKDEDYWLRDIAQESPSAS